MTFAILIEHALSRFDDFCGSRVVALAFARRRSVVGGTIGNPSLSFSFQNQSIDPPPSCLRLQ